MDPEDADVTRRYLASDMGHKTISDVLTNNGWGVSDGTVKNHRLRCDVAE